MPSEVVDVLRVRSPSEQDCEAAMPQIMPAYIRQPGALEERLEVPVDNVLRVNRRADGSAEDEA